MQVCRFPVSCSSRKCHAQAQHDICQLARESGRLTEHLTQGRGVGPGNNGMSNTLDPMSLRRLSCPRSLPPSDQDASDKLKRQTSLNNINGLLSLKAMEDRKAEPEDIPLVQCGDQDGTLGHKIRIGGQSIFHCFVRRSLTV